MSEATSQHRLHAASARQLGACQSHRGLRYVFLLGKGRTGTTWIGQILNRYPRCLYKYEPFNSKGNPHFRRWLDDLDEGDVDELRARFDDLCGRCFHDVDYPPFPRKTCRSQFRLPLRLAWQLGKLCPPARGLYEWYGRPRFHLDEWVSIKEVNLPFLKIRQLTEVLTPKVIAIVRNPYASVDATLRFSQGRRIATVEKSHVIVDRLRGMGVSVPLTPKEVDTMSDATFDAIVWRLQLEPLEAFVRSYRDGMVLKYESFAANPKESAREVFQFLGWEYDDAFDKFIDRTSRGNSVLTSFRRRTQFSIYRDSRAMIERWRKELSEKQVREIRHIVQGSRLLELWPEIEG